MSAKRGAKGAAADPPDKRYRSAEWLEEKYHEENLTLDEIADLCGVTDPCILRWMKKHDIDRKTVNAKAASRGSYNSIKTRLDGIEVLCGDSRVTPHHRVLAGLKYGFENVENKTVTHKNGIPWDNRFENIELVSND